MTNVKNRLDLHSTYKSCCFIKWLLASYVNFIQVWGFLKCRITFQDQLQGINRLEMIVCRTKWGKARPLPPGEKKSRKSSNATPQARRLCLSVPSSGSSTRSRWKSEQMKRRQRVWLTDMRLRRQVSKERAVCLHCLMLIMIGTKKYYCLRSLWNSALSSNDANLVITEVKASASLCLTDKVICFKPRGVWLKW